MDAEDFPASWILLRPLKSPDGIPATIRMRHALKYLLRTWHLKAERVTNVGPDGAKADENPNRPEEKTP